MKSRSAKEPLRPFELCLGNFIESMGNIEMATGIVKTGNDSFKIAHCGWAKGESFLPDDVLYDTYPIPLTDEWMKCLGIDQYQLPEWIKFVHQVQNYFMWALQINLLEIMDWEALPQSVEVNLND